MIYDKDAMANSRSHSNILKFVSADESQEEYLRRSAKAATDAELDVVWISACDIQNITNLKQDRSVFILDPFEGEHFEYLKSQECRICGPQCVLSCMETRSPLPNSSFPIYSVSMCGVFACCTSVPRPERQRLHDLIHMMGGIVMRDFTDAVTHLIAGEVGSKKYSVACSLHKPVMLPEWVFAVWEEAKTKHVIATSEAFDKFKCPFFKGCTICVTGLDAKARQEVRRLCGVHGGIYSGELNMNTCTHLLVNLPRGEKYEFARKWNIHCVSTQWFHDCINTGFWLEETTYRTLPEDEQSMSQPGSRLCSNLSTNTSILSTKSKLEKPTTKAAQAAYKSAQTRGDGGLITDVTKQKRAVDPSRTNTTNISISSETKSTSDLDGMDLDLILTPGSMFLDGCKIFLSGFSGSRLDKLRKIINSGGGTRFNMINEIVSHVVIGSRIAQDVELLKTSDLQPYVVTVNWILESAKSGKKLPEDDYLHPDFRIDMDESAPSSKENKDPVEENKNQLSSQAKKDGLVTKIHHMSIGDDGINDFNDDEVFLQYMSKSDTSTVEPPSKQKEDEDVTFDDDQETGQDNGVGLLSGKLFVIEQFADDQVQHLQQLIEDHGGNITGSDKKADYAVLPMNVIPDGINAQDLVSFCWLEKCLQDGELFIPDASFLYRPFTIPSGATPLCKCVITISQYIGVERDHMMQLAELLGAHCQEHFVRKASLRYMASTHLLCREPDGSKYNAAIRWKIPVTTCNWLFACAKTGTKLPIEDYPVIGSDGAQDQCVSPQKMQVSCTKTDNFSDKDKVSIVLDADDDFDKGYTTVNQLPKEQLLQLMNKEQGIPIPDKIQSFPTLGNKSFRPSFDLSDAMEALASPLVPSFRSRKSRGSRNSFPLDDFFQENIKQAIKRTEKMGGGVHPPQQGVSIEGQCDDTDAEEVVTTNEKGILYGIILAVSKKLSQQQSELYGVASSLGADYRWLYDESCTHLIHQGRANDNTKEFTNARDHGVFIVSPHWLHACAQENQHVDENRYPHTYNPKMSLSVVTSGRRLTRSSKFAMEEINQSEFRKPSEVESETKTCSETSSERSKPGPRRDASELSMESEDRKEEAVPQCTEAEMGTATLQSLDAREDFQKQLEEFMVATKGRRRSRRQNSCSGPGAATNNSSGSNGGADNEKRISLSTRRTSSRIRTRVYSMRDMDKSGHTKRRKQHSTDESEQSQSDTITYDDPAGRLEREKIMAQLKRGCSPSPDIDIMDDVEDNNDDKKDADASKPAPVNLSTKSKGSSSTDDPSKTDSTLEAQLTLLGVSKDADPPSPPTPQTPEPPPVAFQVKEVEKPEPQNLLEEPGESPAVPPRPGIFKFQLSAMTPQEKMDYSALIEQLGGKVFDTMYFNPDCTHVVVGRPNRNEKYLAAMAAGKWVLHKSYLEASRGAECFVAEEPHEWGVEIPGEPSNKLANAAKRWRTKLAQLRKNSSNASDVIGAFTGWAVFLCVDKSRQPGFKRLLEAGGAKVVSVRPPYTNTEGVTHAFIDSNKMKLGTLDVATLHAADILLVKPDYIAEFLMQDPMPNPGKFLIPEAAKLSYGDVNTTQQRKRKGDELTADDKRARLE